MKNLDAGKLLEAEVVPHRKSKEKEGKGAKTPCPGNLDGNGAHMYEVIRENTLLPGGDVHTWHQKECIACGKRGLMKANWKYSGEVYEERNYKSLGWKNGMPQRIRLS